MDGSFFDLSQGIFHVIITNLILSSFRFIHLLKFLFPWLGVSHGSEFAPFSFELLLALVVLLILHHPVTTIISPLIAHQVLSNLPAYITNIVKHILSTNQFFSEKSWWTERTAARDFQLKPSIIFDKTKKLWKINGADASTFTLWHGDHYF